MSSESIPVDGPPYIGGVIVYYDTTEGECPGLIVSIRDPGDNRVNLVWFDEDGTTHRDHKVSYGFNEYEWHWPDNGKNIAGSRL